MQKALLPVSFLTLLAAGWLAVMEMVLRHPGFGGRIALALCIAAVSAATLLAQRFQGGIRAKCWFYAIGGIALLGIGAQALLRNDRAAHFEGFAFVIASAIVLQGVLMVSASVSEATRSLRC